MPRTDTDPALPTFPLTRDETVGFLEYFDAPQTVCPISFSVPFADYTSAMWANLAQFVEVMPAELFSGDEFYKGLFPLESVSEEMTPGGYRQTFSGAAGEVVFEYFFEGTGDVEAPNEFAIHARGQIKRLHLGRMNRADRIAFAFGAHLLGQGEEAGDAYLEAGLNYVCPFNQWSAVIRPDPKLRYYEILLADGRSFGVRFDGSSLTDDEGQDVSLGINTKTLFKSKIRYL